MKHKNITDEQLMEFLYGEVSEKSRREIEEYLREHPEKQKEIEEYGQLRTVLSKYADEENIEKPILTLTPEDRKFKYWAIAASIAFLFSIGWIGFSLTSGENTANERTALSNEQLSRVLDQQKQLATANTALLERITELEGVIERIEGNQQNQLTQIAALKKNSATNEEQIGGYMTKMQEENKKLLNDYFILAENNQKQYLETLLTDYADYISEQRQQDLMAIQTRIESLEQNTGEFQIATAQLMASLTNSNIQFENQ